MLVHCVLKWTTKEQEKEQGEKGEKDQHPRTKQWRTKNTFDKEGWDHKNKESKD